MLLIVFSCGTLSRKESKLDVLINNAGMVRVPGSGLDQITPSGLNVEFAVNVLGHFYLTQLLLPILMSTARSSPDGKVRVVNLSSAAHSGSTIGKNGPIDYKTLEGPQFFPFSPFFAYSQSKSVGSCVLLCSCDG
jgi:retinol dehydrogenase 12